MTTRCWCRSPFPQARARAIRWRSRRRPTGWPAPWRFASPNTGGWRQPSALDRRRRAIRASMAGLRSCPRRFLRRCATPLMAGRCALPSRSPPRSIWAHPTCSCAPMAWPPTPRRSGSGARAICCSPHWAARLTRKASAPGRSTRSCAMARAKGWKSRPSPARCPRAGPRLPGQPNRRSISPGLPPSWVPRCSVG